MTDINTPVNSLMCANEGTYENSPLRKYTVPALF